MSPSENRLDECRCDDPLGLYVCHVHDCDECGGRKADHAPSCRVRLRTERDAARAHVAALRQAIGTMVPTIIRCWLETPGLGELDETIARKVLARVDAAMTATAPPPEPPGARPGKESKP